MRCWYKPIVMKQRDKDDGVVWRKSDMAFSTADRVFTHLKRVLSVSGSAIPDLILARSSRRSFSPHARECLSCSNTTVLRSLWRYPQGPIDKRKRQRLLSCSSLSAANHTRTTEFRLLVDFLPSLAKMLAHHYKTIAPLPYYTKTYLRSRLSSLGIHAGRSIIDLGFFPRVCTPDSAIEVTPLPSIPLGTVYIAMCLVDDSGALSSCREEM
jgi:hypothetical protein